MHWLVGGSVPVEIGKIVSLGPIGADPIRIQQAWRDRPASYHATRP
jgi:hypothetical protein